MKASRMRQKAKQRKKQARIKLRKHAQGIADRLLGHVTFVGHNSRSITGEPGIPILWTRQTPPSQRVIE